MKDHFTQAIHARDAIIRGDLAAMQAPAKWLADARVAETLPADWKPHVIHLQNAARSALQADDLAEAADAIGAMGAACGDCHAELGVRLRFAGMSAEGEASPVLDRMSRHQRAADWMWKGLVRPSDRAWSAGVLALQEAPLWPEDEATPQAAVALADRIHTLAELGPVTQARSARARLYGEYVATCSTCHSLLGLQLGGPGKYR
jgi:cytochrome c556